MESEESGYPMEVLLKPKNNTLYMKAEQFLPIGEKLGPKGISAARVESISVAQFLPGGQKPANTDRNVRQE